ncbi:MAG: electron transport complex subunit RsxC [Paludibacteraceae bacterium]|nr:electron transport complex subunit RsxC [Paludibacteraceae bacterium]
MKTFRLGGIHPKENKITASVPFKYVPIPSEVIIPLDQHIGAPAVPCVAVGDKVKAGQTIGNPGGFVSAAVHSSVSGTVKKIENVRDAWGVLHNCVIITVEGDDWMENIDKSDTLITECKLEAKEILDKITASGIVGLGGACFPTQVKLMPPKDAKIDTLIVNAVECEPYLTHNHRLMLEKGNEVIVGVKIILKALGINKAIIGVENNKKDAIEHLKSLLPKYNTDGVQISVEALKMKYPQGGEKQLIHALTGRVVRSGAIPAATGVVVQNVATVFAVYEAVQKNKPIMEIALTVSGKKVANPGNFILRIGTPLADAVAMAGGIPDGTGKLICGGPMMGRSMISVNTPANKRTSAVVMLDEKESVRGKETNCMRCGKCVEACPMGLEPYLLSKMSKLKMYDEAEAHAIFDCIECGCCAFSCPSNRPLLDYVRLGKAQVMAIMKNRNNK